MIKETLSKVLWYTKSDKEVRYYNPSAHCNLQQDTIFFLNFAKPFRKIVAEINLLSI